jgi:vacuolar-type H+-ATPase subunit H
LTDNEVMREITVKTEQLAELIEASNGLRKQILSELEQKEGGLVSREELAKQWAAVQAKQEVMPKKEQKKAKKRDKVG